MKHSAVISARLNTPVRERHTNENGLINIFKGLFVKQKVKIHEETFPVAEVLKKLHLALKSVGIDNLVRLTHDNIDYYLDEESKPHDLPIILKQFKSEIENAFERFYEEISVIVETQFENLLYLLELNLNRVHPIGEYPIQINFLAIPENSSIEETDSKFLLFVNKIEQEVQKYLNVKDIEIKILKTNSEKKVYESPADIRYGKKSRNPFFPLNGITLGETSLNELKRKGKEAKEIDAELKTLNYYTVRNIKIWHDNKVASYVYFTCLEALPRPWQRLGLTWDLSYTQYINFFENSGYFINVTVPPKSSWYLGKKTLVAEFQAITTINEDLQYVFELYFNYSKKDSINDRGTIYSMKVIAN